LTFVVTRSLSRTSGAVTYELNTDCYYIRETDGNDRKRAGHVLWRHTHAGRVTSLLFHHVTAASPRLCGLKTAAEVSRELVRDNKTFILARSLCMVRDNVDASK